MLDAAVQWTRSSVVEHLTCPDRLFPSSSLRSTVNKKRELARKEREMRSHLGHSKVNTFRLRKQPQKGKAVGSNLQKFFFQMGARVKQVEVAPPPSGWQRGGSREGD